MLSCKRHHFQSVNTHPWPYLFLLWAENMFAASSGGKSFLVSAFLWSQATCDRCNVTSMNIFAAIGGQCKYVQLCPKYTQDPQRWKKSNIPIETRHPKLPILITPTPLWGYVITTASEHWKRWFRFCINKATLTGQYGKTVYAEQRGRLIMQRRAKKEKKEV